MGEVLVAVSPIAFKKPRARQWWKNQAGGLFRVDKVRGGKIHGFRVSTGEGGIYVKATEEVNDFLREFDYLWSFKP
jgi:hypothetical protein